MRGFFEVKNSGGFYFRVCVLWLIFLDLLLLGCAETPLRGLPVKSARLTDGTYQGSYRGGPNKAVVAVTIKNRKIVHIVIVEHQAWRGKKAEAPIVERIIATQSTQVDAISGATNSSRVIMNAVQKAVEKAYKKITN
jgi:uncharacterized protein with FMN-binding domain